jgi:hypothetical protein
VNRNIIIIIIIIIIIMGNNKRNVLSFQSAKCRIRDEAPGLKTEDVIMCCVVRFMGRWQVSTSNDGMTVSWKETRKPGKEPAAEALR